MSNHTHNQSSHGSLTSYIVGLVLSLILTAVAFGYVWTQEEVTQTVVAIVAVTAIAQVLVQMIFFLHMTGKKEQAWESAAGLYILLSLLLLIFLSVWIFHHFRLNTMMVGH